MKDLLPGDRPREKLLRHGVAALGDNELVAIVLGTGSESAGALEVANDLLASRGGLRGIARSSCGELARTGGVGPAKAARLLAALEVGRRTLMRDPSERVLIGSPRDAALYLLPAFGSRPVECFGIVLLDTSHRVLGTRIVAVGTMTGTVVEPRDVFREAMLGGATAVVVFHNHPSGDPSPSPDDLEVTGRLVAAGILLGIDVVDHLILGDARYCSLKEQNRLRR
jgi:DNA repair protein RadC